MRSLFAFALVACLTNCGACSGKKKQHRGGDAAPVEVVNTPIVDGASGTAGGDEVEPNDGDDVAMSLPLGQTIHGKIEPETDVDHFKIEVAQAGTLAIDVTVLDGDVVLELEDSTGTVVARSDRGVAKVKEGVPNFGVTPGHYTAVVKAKPPKKPAKKPVTPPSPLVAVYDITASVTTKPAANAEREPDDDRGTANDLILGDNGTGYIGWTNDVDVWKVSLETLAAKNAMEIEIGQVEGIVLQLDVADGLGQTIVSRKGPRGGPLIVRGLVPNAPAGSPPFQYLTVKADKSNPETPYQISIKEKPRQPDDEAEPNDSVDKAYAIPADRTVVHAMWSAGDVDCFAVAPDAAARTVEAKVDTPSEADLRVELTVDGKLVGKADRPGKGAQEKITGPVPAGGHAVICVRGTDIPGEGAYDVTIKDLPPGP